MTGSGEATWADFAEAFFERWARGEIDDEALVEETLKRFGPGTSVT